MSSSLSFICARADIRYASPMQMNQTSPGGAVGNAVVEPRTVLCLVADSSLTCVVACLDGLSFPILSL